MILPLGFRRHVALWGYWIWIIAWRFSGKQSFVFRNVPDWVVVVFAWQENHQIKRIAEQATEEWKCRLEEEMKKSVH